MVTPNYMQIRAYLYSIISKADSAKTQLPTENELCRLFGVSRMTARTAIKGLVDDKFIIPRRGLGTFINPAKLSKENLKIPVVGVIYTDGRNVLNSIVPSIAECIRECAMAVMPLFIPDSHSPDTFIEIARKEVDAIVWDTPKRNRETETLVKRILEERIPFLIIDRYASPPLAGADRIVSELPGRRGLNLVDYVVAHGFKSLLLVYNNPACTQPGSAHDIYCARMKELFPGDPSAKQDAMSLQDFLRKLRTEGKAFLKTFDLLYTLLECVQPLTPALAEAGIEIPRDISLLVFEKANPGLCGGLRPAFIDPDSIIRRHLAEWLLAKVREPRDATSFLREFEMEIVEGETTKQKAKATP